MNECVSQSRGGRDELAKLRHAQAIAHCGSLLLRSRLDAPEDG